MHKRFFISIVGLVLSIILKPIPITAQQSAERLSERNQHQSPSEPRKHSEATNKQPGEDLRGTESSPVIVKVLPTPKTKEETAQDQQSRQDQSAANWWMVKLTGAIVLIGIIQVFVFGLQARRLRQTILKMEEIAKGQTEDMKASIGEATRAAIAMEGIAASMGSSVQSVKESVGISREIADRQKLITELQSRAYLSVEFYTMVPQNTQTGVRFEPRVSVINRGSTPAYKVRLQSKAEIVPFPVPEDFSFALPQPLLGGSVSIIAAGMNKITSSVVPIPVEKYKGVFS